MKRLLIAMLLAATSASAVAAVDDAYVRLESCAVDQARALAQSSTEPADALAGAAVGLCSDQQEAFAAELFDLFPLGADRDARETYQFRMSFLHQRLLAEIVLARSQR